MSIRRRSIANRILRWFGTTDSEKGRRVQETLSRNSRLSRYIAYHLRRLPTND